MPATLILQNIQQHISLTPEEQQHFLSLLVAKKIKRKQYFLREGEVCRHSAFVVQGCLRGYTVDKNGFEHVLSFAPPDWWMGDMYSLLSHKPGILNIDALEDTEVMLLPVADQEKLYNDIPRFERFFRIIISNSLVAYQQRLIDNLSLQAEERYKKFCSIYPTLINTLPQKQIAAYIGVTPEFLSTIRKQFLRRQ